MCCGSDTVTEDSVLESTGNFSRSSVGGAFTVTGSANYNPPPGEVKDFAIGNLDFDLKQFNINFTAPGDNLDDGTGTYLHCALHWLKSVHLYNA